MNKSNHIVSILAFIFIFVSAVIKIYNFGFNPSFRLDEANLALNIIEVPFSHLFFPLESRQVAPVGFMLVSKFFTQIFSINEMAFRIIPFVSSLVSPFVFYVFTRKFMDTVPMILALFVFCISDNLFFFAIDFKQYSSDVMLSLILLNQAYSLITGPITKKRIYILALLGGIIFWFSFVSVFLLTSITGVIILKFIKEKNSSFLKHYLVVAGFWFLNFLIFYVLMLSRPETHGVLYEYWKSGFFVNILTDHLEQARLIEAFSLMFFSIGEYTQVFLAFCFFIIGSWIMAKRNIYLCIIFNVTWILIFFAACIGKYPAVGRNLMILMPIVQIFVWQGVWTLLSRKNYTVKCVAVVCAVALLYSPFLKFMEKIQRPIKAPGARPVLKYIQENIHPTDSIYVYYAASSIYKFYLKTIPLDQYETYYSKGKKGHWDILVNDFKNFSSNKERIWVFFDHIHIFDDGLPLYFDQNVTEFVTKKDKLIKASAATILYEVK